MNDQDRERQVDDILARYGESKVSPEARRAAAACFAARNAPQNTDVLKRRIAGAGAGGPWAALLEHPLPVAFIASAFANAAVALLAPSWYALALRAAVGALWR